MPSPLKNLFGVNPLDRTESPVLSFPKNLGAKLDGINNLAHYVFFTIKPTASNPDIPLDIISKIAEAGLSLTAEKERTDSSIVSMDASTKTTSNLGLGLGKNNRLTRPTGDPEYIALYLPTVIQNNQTAKYNDVEMGNIISLLSNSSGGTFNSIKDLATKFVANKAKQAGGAELSSITSAYEIMSGRVTNNQVESVFENIDKRTFQFDFRMIPRNPKEADDIQRIVRKFRAHMAPSIPTGNTTFMTVPSLFEIQFFSGNEVNKTLPIIRESVCTTCSVSYGGERIALHSSIESTDGKTYHPVETSMTLAFQEIPIITKEDILERGA